jgi:hypothetical protein
MIARFGGESCSRARRNRAAERDRRRHNQYGRRLGPGPPRSALRRQAAARPPYGEDFPHRLIDLCTAHSDGLVGFASL